MLSRTTIEIISKVGNYRFIGSWNQRKSIFGNFYWLTEKASYEHRESLIVKENLKSKDVFIDAGAHHGYFSLLAASITTAPIYAFEPSLQQFRLLQTNILINNLENVIPYPYALLNREATGHVKTARMRLIPAISDYNLKESDRQSIANHDERFEVATIKRFDDLRKTIDIAVVNFIKMDIEGAEYHALEGMKDTLAQEKPKILLSVHPSKLKSFKKTQKDVFQLLNSYDYHYRVVGRRSLQKVQSSQANYSLFCY